MRRVLPLLVLLAVVAPAPAADLEAARAKAVTVCAACHGATGISVGEAIPNLAAQRAGYLASQGILSLPLVFGSAALADCLGTSLLFLVFYAFGHRLMRRPPRWFPVAKVERLKERLSERYPSPWLEGFQGLTRVKFGPYSSREEAEAARDSLAELGLAGIVVAHR